MKTKLFGVALAAAMALGANACKQDQAAAPAKAQQGIKVTPAEGSAATPAPGEGGQPAVHGDQGAPGGDAAAAAGKVLETMDSGGYSYLKIETPAGEKWAAVRQTTVKVGDVVTIEKAMVMRGFTSKTLDRTFDEILFGELGASGGSAAGAPGAAPSGAPTGEIPPGHPPVAGGETGEVAGAHGVPAGARAEVAGLEKAEGGYTIAEVFAKKAELSGQEIAIRAKVTKYNPGIMGRNWLHIQDGSGSPDTKDFDLTITTTGDAAVDEVVLIKGKLSLNRDFGAGYAYDVIVEDATVAR